VNWHVHDLKEQATKETVFYTQNQSNFLNAVGYLMMNFDMRYDA
jgi:hypothetical protein